MLAMVARGRACCVELEMTDTERESEWCSRRGCWSVGGRSGYG